MVRKAGGLGVIVFNSVSYPDPFGSVSFWSVGSGSVSSDPLQ